MDKTNSNAEIYPYFIKLELYVHATLQPPNLITF